MSHNHIAFSIFICILEFFVNGCGGISTKSLSRFCPTANGQELRVDATAEAAQRSSE